MDNEFDTGKQSTNNGPFYLAMFAIACFIGVIGIEEIQLSNKQDKIEQLKSKLHECNKEQ